MFNLTEKMKEKMLHASGLSNKKTAYRNYYNTEVDDPEWLYLVSVGLATGSRVTSSSLDGFGDFFLTDLGVDLAYGIKRRKEEREK